MNDKLKHTNNYAAEFEGSRLEADKLRYDLFKHLTTLNTGSILIVGATIKNLFPDPKSLSLIFYAFSCFLVSIVGSLIGMFMKSFQVHYGKSLEEKDRYFAGMSTLLALMLFVSGLVLVIFFLWANLNEPKV